MRKDVLTFYETQKQFIERLAKATGESFEESAVSTIKIVEGILADHQAEETTHE